MGSLLPTQPPTIHSKRGQVQYSKPANEIVIPEYPGYCKVYLYYNNSYCSNAYCSNQKKSGTCPQEPCYPATRKLRPPSRRPLSRRLPSRKPLLQRLPLPRKLLIKRSLTLSPVLKKVEHLVPQSGKWVEVGPEKFPLKFLNKWSRRNK